MSISAHFLSTVSTSCCHLQARSARAPIPEADLEELPAVDDLMIAAGAAAGVPDPVGPILRRVLGIESEDEAEAVHEDDNPEAMDVQAEPASESPEVCGHSHLCKYN